MAVYIPKFRRSTGGCLTCKRRRKKCDETRPVCKRCINGDFACMGYNESTPSNGSGSNMSNKETGIGRSSEHRFSQHSIDDPYFALLSELAPLPASLSPAGAVMQSAVWRKATCCFAGIPRRSQMDPFTLNHVIPLIISQYAKHYQYMVFKPASSHMDEGTRSRANWSDITRWSMYLGAKIIQDISSGRDGQMHKTWITRFHTQILESSTSAELALVDLDARLAGLQDLTTLMFIVSNTSTGYQMFKQCTPIFLRSAAKFPELWSNESTISISAAVRSPHYEIGKFVLHDTLIALVLGVPSCVYYDTSAGWIEAEEQNPYLKWVYGFPAGIVVLLARINAWRTSRLVGGAVFSNQGEWRELEERLMRWIPTVDRTDESFDVVTRLAVQECWRQAVLIYLYMVACEVNSADPRVESAVRQIVQLANAIEPNSRLEMHLFIPCLIAGAAARYEPHRSTLRNKVLCCRDQLTLILRGADFASVLDYLWHGDSAEGRSCTWEDYVRARYVVLPVEA